MRSPCLKKLTMGCPQGSVLGPTLWIVLFDAFLRMRLPEGCHSFAYADVGLLLVEANSRKGLEAKTKIVCEMIEDWSKENRLQLSVGKTKIMLLKGKLKGRQPIVKLYGESIQYAKEIRYLGVILDESLSFKPHIESACKKAISIFHKVSSISKANWGLRFREILTIYKGIGEAILLYGAAAWAHRLDLSTYANRMIRAQRTMLIKVCKGYRTLSAEALQVLAGIQPIDLKAKERKDRYWCKRLEQNNLQEIRERYLDQCQERWTTTSKGRNLYKYWPNIRERLIMPIETNHYMTQFMTGHGNFASYLHRFGLRISAECSTCGIEDTHRTNLPISGRAYGLRRT